jgi:hypothetical protein
MVLYNSANLKAYPVNNKLNKLGLNTTDKTVIEHLNIRNYRRYIRQTSTLFPVEFDSAQSPRPTFKLKVRSKISELYLLYPHI